MNILDLFIIYLACGSPFGAFYYFKYRRPKNFRFLKSLMISFVWIPYAVKLFHTEFTKKLNRRKFFKKAEKSEKEEISELTRIQNLFETLALGDGNGKLSLFEVREIIDRYAGLSRSMKFSKAEPARCEKEFFEISGAKNTEVAMICLNRRNRRKLNFHHTQAREDFLKLFEILLQRGGATKNVSRDALEFVRILGDVEAFTQINQSIEKFAVIGKVGETDNPAQISKDSEKSFERQLEESDLWTRQKHSKKEQVKTLSLQTLTATTTAVYKKD